MHVKATRSGEIMEDETSCGPLCQHPACWQSNQRVEKGFPRVKKKDVSVSEDDFDIPKLTVFNVIEDKMQAEEIFSRYNNLPHSERRSRSYHLSDSQRKVGTPGSYKVPPVPLVTPAPTLSPFMKPRVTQTQEDKSKMKMVEVQEVFDVDDLNNTWNNTFLSKKCYVWVPNPNKAQQRQKLDPIDSTTTGQLSKDNTVLVKDVTEEMVPEEVEIQRMNSIVYDELPVIKKRQIQRNRSPTSRNRTYPQSPRIASVYKPEFDAEGISELLDLPRDVLIKVLEHTKQSDFTSKDIIHEIIKQFLPAWDPDAAKKQHILRQTKLPLKENRMRNVRQPEMMISKPIFHLDRPNGMTSRDSPDKEILDFDVNAYVAYKNPNLLKEIPRYKRPLPAISGYAKNDNLDSQKKVPNISLGLPELPSGIQATKPFTYKQKFLDFSLGPVPTPPGSVRSSAGSPSSDHGTSINETGRSQSNKLEFEIPHVQKEYRLPSETTIGDRNTVEWSPGHAVSPTLSSRVPRAPATTPATAAGHHSPSKSSLKRYGSAEGAILQPESSSAHRRIKSPSSQPPQLSPEHTGLLGTIEESGVDDAQSRSEIAKSKYNVTFGDNKAHDIPPQRPSSPQDHAAHREERKVETQLTRSPNAVNISIPSPETDEPTPRQNLTASSPEPETWPEVVENVFVVGNDEANKESTEKGDNVDQTIKQPPRTPVSRERNQDSRGSDRSSHVKKLSEALKTESPAPPPPSPEPRDVDKETIVHERVPKVYTEGRDVILEDRAGRRLNLPSRESSVMEPLIEESEPTESDRDHGTVQASSVENVFSSSDNTTPSTQQHNSQNTQKPKSPQKGQRTPDLPREKSVDTFVNVDIPASTAGHETGTDQRTKDTKIKGSEEIHSKCHSPEIVKSYISEDVDTDTKAVHESMQLAEPNGSEVTKTDDEQNGTDSVPGQVDDKETEGGINDQTGSDQAIAEPADTSDINTS